MSLVKKIALCAAASLLLYCSESKQSQFKFSMNAEEELTTSPELRELRKQTIEYDEQGRACIRVEDAIGEYLSCR